MSDPYRKKEGDNLVNLTLARLAKSINATCEDMSDSQDACILMQGTQIGRLTGELQSLNRVWLEVLGIGERNEVKLLTALGDENLTYGELAAKYKLEVTPW